MLAGFISALPKTVTLSDDASVSVFMNTPHVKRQWLKGQHRVSFTMWETDALPDYFTRWIGKYDQVLVPCEHNVELFSQHHSDVKKVPLGVDTKFWAGYTEPSGKFRFNAGGSLWMRKGLDLVVEAFTRLNLSDAELHIKAAPHARDTPDVKHPNIVMHRSWMSAEDQREWFSQGHVFVAPSRGEGFGLMPLQAISMGVPTIVSHSSGHREFSYLATGVVDVKKKPAPTGGCWEEADVDQLAEVMLAHYQDWVKYRDEAVVGSRGCQAFTWRKATKALLDSVPVGMVLDEPVQEVVQVTAEIQVRKKLSCTIGTNSYSFLPGETYTVPEGVVQVLTDSGYLV